MSATAPLWQHLERRSGSSYQQLCVKGKRIWAWTLYSETMNVAEPRTPQQLAADFDVPVAAVPEAIAYCQSNPAAIRADQRKDALRAATTEADAAGKLSGRPRPLATEERVRLGL